MKDKLLEYFKLLISSIGAGLLIGFGGFVYLNVKGTSPIFASFLFSLGLFCIIVFKLHLFTGKVGYILDNKPKYLLDLLVIFIGNVIGAGAMGFLGRLTRMNVCEVAEAVTTTKLNDSLLSVFLLGMGCGVMIFIAVEVQRYDIHPISKLFGVVIPIIVFILCGFEHCVADAYYFSAANMWSLKAVGYILMIALGNGIGSMICYILLRYCQGKLFKKKEEVNKLPQEENKKD